MSINIGDSASLKKAFSSDEVAAFADLSTDHNPIHLDEAAAQQSVFGQRVVHGALSASLFSSLLGTQLPGPGSIYLGQTLSFKRPVYIDEEVTAVVEVIALDARKPIATLRTQLFKADGKLAIDGEASVRLPG